MKDLSYFSVRLVAAITVLLLQCTPSPAGSDDRQFDSFGDPLPPHAVMRLGTVRLRHPKGVTDLAFSPSGDLLASLGLDRKIRLWNVKTGEQLQELAPASAYGEIAFSEDGTRIISLARKGMVMAWDLGNGELLTKGHQSSSGSKRSLAAHGTREVKVLGRDNIVIRDLKTGEEVKVSGKSDARKVTLSADGRVLAYADHDYQKVFIGDSATGRLSGSIDVHNPRWPSSIALSGDGSLLATGHYSGGKVCLWKVPSGEQVGCHGFARGYPYSLEFSPDGRFIAASNDIGNLILWDLPGFSIRHSLVFPLGRLSHLSFSPESDLLAISSDHNAIVLIDPETGERVDKDIVHDDALYSMAVSPNGRRLVTTGRNESLRLWDLDSGAHLRATSMKKVDYISYQVLFSPKGDRLLLGGSGSVMRELDTETGKVLRRFEGHRNDVGSMALSPDGRMLVALGLNKPALYFWSLEKGTLLRKVPLDTLEGVRWPLLFFPEGSRLALGQTGMIRVFDAGSGDQLGSVPIEENSTIVLAVAPDGTLLTWEYGGGVVLLNSRDYSRKDVIRARHPGCLAVSPDGMLFASGDVDTIQVWDLPAGKRLFSLEGHTDKVTLLAFTPDGKRLISGSRDTTVLVWELPAVKTSDLSR